MKGRASWEWMLFRRVIDEMRVVGSGLIAPLSLPLFPEATLRNEFDVEDAGAMTKMMISKSVRGTLTCIENKFDRREKQ